MSIYLVPSDDGENLLMQMSNKRAEMFLDLTLVAGQVYGVSEEAITRGASEFLVWKDPFCVTFERVFQDPVDLMGPWTEYGCWWYEYFAKEVCEFVWDVSGLSTLENRASFRATPSWTRLGGEVPTRIVGPRHLNTITGFKAR